MSELAGLWFGVCALACMIALIDWKRAVYVGIVVDALRDPVRKLIPNAPVTITLAGAVVWLVIVGAAAISQRDQLRALFRAHPRLRIAFHLLLLALIPAAAISTFSYSRGWLMAVIGAASYLIPGLGVLAGYSLIRREHDAAKILLCYIVVNSAMLISVPLEFFDFPVPALGGIDFDWIRYRQGYTVDLMTGWYRSPDIMGLHAAHVIMFSLLLAIRPGSRAAAAWLVPVVWAAFCVLVSGRRKMLGIPLVFLSSFVMLGMYFRVTRVSRMTGFVIVAASVGICVTMFLWSTDESSEYTEFASSLFTEGADRANTLIVGSTLGTLRQVGIVGGGLGAATQGKHYIGSRSERHLRGWQEDGVSRLVLEFGVPGAILLLFSVALLVQTLFRSLKQLPPRSGEAIMQIGLVSVIAGDAASYAISHQQFSGDPVSALFVTLMFGMVLRLPVIYRSARQQPTPQRSREPANPLVRLAGQRTVGPIDEVA